MRCRHCGSEASVPFLDLGSAPPSNALLTEEALRAPERWYPLRVVACTACWLVQTEDYAHHAELFSDEYVYFSSFSTTWVAHAKAYVDAVAARFNLGANSMVVEVASNDGYLLQHVRALGIPCLGIEPTKGTARAARAKGIEVLEEFFGRDLAARVMSARGPADLIVANNVLAHVPDINDFAAGVARLLKPDGVATFEFPHLLQTVRHAQFDTIYHEHFSYLSLTAARAVLAANGLSVFDVEELPTHGGSLRVFAQPTDGGARAASPGVQNVLAAERAEGMLSADYYFRFQRVAERVKNEFAAFLIDARAKGRKVAGYGAAAKGSTLMNYAGVRPDLLAFVADRNPAKQHHYMPGSRIPITPEDRLRAERPDFVVLFPWNLKRELVEQLAYIREWGGQFVTAVPALEVVP